MAYQISDACISCGSCAGECPVGAISEGDGKYQIEQVHAWIAVLALALARWVQSLRSNLLPSNVHQKASV